MRRACPPLLFLLITAACIAADATGPEPAPWWMKVEEAQTLAMKWLATLTVIAGGIAGFVAYVLAKVNAIKEQQREQAQQQADAQKAQNDRLNVHAEQITTLALTSAPPMQTITQNNPPPNEH